MEIQTSVKCRVKVMASMEEDGTVSGKIVGFMPYASEKELAGGNKAAGILPEVSGEIVLKEEDRKALGEIFAGIVKRESEALAVKMADARASARRVAKEMGELI